MLHSPTVSELFPSHSTSGAREAEPRPHAGIDSASLRLLITGDSNGLAGVLTAIDRHFPAPVHLFAGIAAPALHDAPERAYEAVLNRFDDWLTTQGARGMAISDGIVTE